MKVDAAGIKQFVEALPVKAGLAGTTRATWPLYLFRIDDVRAVASVLERGAIYSRNRAIELGLLDHDAASPAVIEQSPDWIKRCVRLYFRPRTPTEYRSEGFRPAAALPMGAHRPMPVVLVFDSVPILTADNTLFTNGNAASWGVKHGGTIEFLNSIPFEKVYHEGTVKTDEKAEIVFRRCAEVLVPNQLELANLKHVFCRSQAEYETLVNILTEPTRKAFAKKIGVSARLHYKHWTFLEAVDLTPAQITFRFAPYSQTPGPFHAYIEIANGAGHVIGRWEDPSWQAIGPKAFSLEQLGNLSAYRVTLKLDGFLAYAGVFTDKEALL